MTDKYVHNVKPRNIT